MLGPLEFGLFSALAVYLIITDSTRVVFWVFALVFFVGLATWYPINSHRQLNGIQQLQQQLNTGRSAAPSASRRTAAEGDGIGVRDP